jgi:Flp pilus assembly protein TadD
MIGMIFDMQNRATEARQVYEEIVRATSRAPVAANNLAWNYADKGENLDYALQLAQQAKAQLPDRHEVDNTLGWVYFKKNMVELAIPPLERSVKKDPANSMYQYHLGLAYAKAGRKDAARRALEEALKLNRDFPGRSDAETTLAALKG